MELNLLIFRGAKMRGRKKKDDSKTKVISFRLTEKQYELLSNNNWIKKEIEKQIVEYINVFITDASSYKKEI